MKSEPLVVLVITCIAQLQPANAQAPAVADLMGGHVDLMFDVLPSSMPHVKARKLKALGVASVGRSPSLPA